MMIKIKKKLKTAQIMTAVAPIYNSTIIRVCLDQGSNEGLMNVVKSFL